MAHAKDHRNEPTFDFVEAVKRIKQGRVVARKKWLESNGTAASYSRLSRETIERNQPDNFCLLTESIFAEDWFEVVETMAFLDVLKELTGTTKTASRQVWSDGTRILVDGKSVGIVADRFSVPVRYFLDCDDLTATDWIVNP